MGKKYVYKGLLAALAIAVVLASLIGIFGSFLLNIVNVRWLGIFFVLYSVMMFVAVLFSVNVTCFDNEGFYNIRIFGKGKMCLWTEIIKVEYIVLPDIYGIFKKYLAVYTNENFLRPEFGRPRYIRKKSNDAFVLLGEQAVVFREYIEKYRPELIIERYEINV